MQTSESLRRLVLEYYAAVNSHDEGALKERSVLTPGASMIGTDGGEWFVGHEGVQGAFARQFIEYGDVVFEPGEVIAWAQDDAGWFLDQPTLVLGDQRTTCRCSGTALLVDGRWRIVQTHMSLPGGN